MSDRNLNGTFANGNAGGPGRPRLIEASYLATLAATVSLETWQAICKRAVDDALAGDAKARDWLCRYLLGTNPPTLLAVAADEHNGISTADAIERAANKAKRSRALDELLSPNPG